MEVIFYLVLLALLVFNIKDIKNQPFSPWNLTIIVWTTIAILYLLQTSLYPLSDRFYLCCTMWLLSFYTMSKTQCRKNIKKENNDFRDSINPKILYAYYLLIIVGLPLYSSAYLNAIGGFSIEALADIRDNAVNGDVALGYLFFIPALCKSVLLIELYLFKPNRWKNLVFAITINIIPAIVILEKGYLAYIFISVMFFLKKKEYIKTSSLAYLSIGFFVIMFVFNALRTMAVSDSKIQDFAALYCVSPSVAFCNLTTGQSAQWGEHTFRFFYAILHSLGLASNPVSNWYEPVFVPIRTNVFTIMEPYYYDFGALGVLIFGIIDGFFCGKIYNSFLKKKGIVITCIYAYITHILILQFFQEYFLVSLSVTIQITICIYFATLNSKKTKIS